MPSVASALYLRPESARPKAWERLEMDATLAMFLDQVWNSRSVPWAGLPHPAAKALENLWQEAVIIQKTEDLSHWVQQLRQVAWGDTRPLSDWFNELDRDEQLARTAQARLLIGQPLIQMFATEQWRTTLENIERVLQRKESQQGRPVEAVALLGQYAQQRQKVRAKHHPQHELPAGRVMEAHVRTLAEQLQARFGLKHLRTGGAMSTADVWSALRETERGLSTLAQALGWPESDIGAQRIGLSLELDVDQGAKATYDPLTDTLNLGLSGGWGSFAHEWAHALDRVLFKTMNPHPMRTHGYASVLAEDQLEWLAPEHHTLRRLLADRDRLAPTPQSPVQAHLALIQSLPNVLRRLEADLPHEDWRPRFQTRIRALEVWIAHHACQPDRDLDVVRQMWDRWRLGNRIAFADPDDEASSAWRKRWNRLVKVGESIAFGPPPTLPAWRVWAQARDAFDGTTDDNWDSPQERFARAFHAHVRQRIGMDSWAADAADRADEFPLGTELNRQAPFWEAVLQAARPLWTQEVSRPGLRHVG